MNKDKLAHAGQYLTFTLNQQMFGVPIEVVREINQLPQVTPVPNSPTCVAGVINLRDKVVPVVDLRCKFNLPRTPYTRETCVIVVDGRQGLVATIVDTVASVLPFRQDQIDGPPPLVQTHDSAYAPLLGLGKQGQQVIVLLNMTQVVDQELIHEVLELPPLSAS